MSLPTSVIHNNIMPANRTDSAKYAEYRQTPALYELGATRKRNISSGPSEPDTDNFSNHGYQSPTITDWTKNREQIKTEIQTKQIDPMIKVADDYTQLMKSIDSKYSNLSTNITTTQNVQLDLSNNPIYGHFDYNYDMGPPIKNVVDLRLDDIDEVISQTNAAYTLGTITAMTLIIAGIFVFRN
jgi:hypothetical protein